jgi:hypothetical protein
MDGYVYVTVTNLAILFFVLSFLNFGVFLRLPKMIAIVSNREDKMVVSRSMQMWLSMEKSFIE